MLRSFFTVYAALLSAFFPLVLTGQTVTDVAGAFGHPADSLGLGEKLVELAWENYPEVNTYRHEVEREQENISQAKWNWLNDVSASFNLNEGNLNPELNTTNIFFPRYNFRLAVSVGTFINTPSKVRQARLGKQIAGENVNLQRLIIRREVLSRYYTYLYNIDLLKIKMQAYQDVQSAYTSANRSFNQGEIGLLEYNEALNARNAALEARIMAEHELVMSKLLLEELIGMPLEQARDLAMEKRN